MGSQDRLPRQAPTESGAWLRFGDRDVEIPEDAANRRPRSSFSVPLAKLPYLKSY
jgi:hypothetical protein